MAAAPVVYLLHFERPYQGRSQHYTGYTNDLPRRIGEHRRGAGRGISRVAFRQGIGFILARTWAPGSMKLEREIKSQAVRYCPLCPGEPLIKPQPEGAGPRP